VGDYTPQGLPVGGPGILGAATLSRYVGATTGGAPATGTFAVGDYVIDVTGKVFICTVAGSPGTWAVVGSSITGAFTTTGDVTAQSGNAAQVVIGDEGPALQAGIEFGLAGDAGIYRGSPAALVTVGSFQTNAGQDISAGGSLVARVGTPTQVTIGGTLGASGLAIQAGAYAGGTNIGGTISYGTGAPNNANGVNGDIYLRVDGGVLTTIYQRRAAVWTGIV
jgi:hypothetical protein